MYTPIQNGITKSTPSVNYIEATLPDDLSEVVYCFWELKTTTILPQDFHYHVLPDACIDIIFNLENPEPATIMTPHVISTELNLGKFFHYVGIRLLPGVWQGNVTNIIGSHIDTPHLGTIPVAEITQSLKNHTFPVQQTILANITRQLKTEELLRLNPTARKILTHLNDIHSVADMAAIACLSTRQLQRTLKHTTGFTPHDLLKVLRFQQSFQQDYHMLYTDQAHFIHSFRRITGWTPSRYTQKFNV